MYHIMFQALHPILEKVHSFNIEYNTFDILTDEDVRSNLKEFSDWPTFPQLYVKGQFVGGLDIVKEMQDDGPLKQQFDDME